MSDNKKMIQQRLNSLLSLMTREQCDAVLIAHDDEYLSEELSDDCQRIRYLTGFTGSAGICTLARPDISKIVQNDFKLTEKKNDHVNLQRCAAVFVDGRYTVQAKKQLNPELFDSFVITELTPSEWL